MSHRFVGPQILKFTTWTLSLIYIYESRLSCLTKSLLEMSEEGSCVHSHGGLSVCMYVWSHISQEYGSTR